jgi:hypothetical protein
LYPQGPRHGVAAEEKNEVDEDKLVALRKINSSPERWAVERQEALDATHAAEHAEEARVVDKAVADANALVSMTLMFEYVIGRKFSCPWKLCNMWKVSSLSGSTLFATNHLHREWSISYSKSVSA